ncbi:luciferin 4-monooxygenase [Manduca sexta]|uniref:luciferin 4-monooxygenase n=1 Tax=Manduca sexta TaxID=7130 RepID=UPI00188DFAC3|nr:luciferin 4-monooxygenase [Manduca sexta]
MERASDLNFHMGQLFLDSMKRRPDAICQIDHATGEQETNASVLKRSIRLARCFRKLGFKPGDVLALGGRNHMDLFIPYYAALMNGLPIVGVDPLFKFDEINTVIKTTRPKVAFCQKENYCDFVKAAEQANIDTKVFTFDGENPMAELIEQYDDNSPIDDFQVATFDLSKIYAWLVSSGGTTGIIKFAAFTHMAWFQKMMSPALTMFNKKKAEELTPRNGLHISPIQWISGFFNPIIMPLTKMTRVQSSSPNLTTGDIIDMINIYKPATVMMSPTLASSMIKHEKVCDFACFNMVILTGGKVYPDVWSEVQKRTREDAAVFEIYGQTENLGPIFLPNPKGPVGNCGKRSDAVLVKLIDPDTGKEITEPGVPGELWTKGICFAEYYNNPEETAKAFTEDGWFKTGDLLYRDAEDNFFFVERLKMVIKNRGYTIVPPEIEEVIRQHEGVYDVSVTSVDDADEGDLPVACVVRNKGANVTAQEIKDLVASKLSASKQLRGGVAFMDALPMTSAGKIARAKLKTMVADLQRE